MMRIRRILCAALTVCLLGFVLPSLAEGTTIKTLQERLISLGYEIGTADGIVGKKTSMAIMLAQEALRENGHNVEPSGTPDPETVSLIMQEENTDLFRTLRPGSWGNRVKQIQNQLAGLNLLQDSVDGIYGTNTENAVKAFEEAMAAHVPGKITADGKLTPDEYDLLMGNLDTYGFEAPVLFDESHPEKLNGNYLYAKHAILINAVTGETLLEKDADTPAEPASTTKIMTLITALSLCDPDKMIVIPEEALDIPDDSTRVPVCPGEKMTMKDLLYGMMIRSGNDAANSVAVLCSGSLDAFAEEMNQKAEELGMTNSHFVNPHGYTAEGHYASARDLVTAARYGLTQPLFREIVTCLYYTLPVTEQRKDPLISLKWEIYNPGSEYYISHAAGGKSGYTSTAGFCYVGAYQESGITLIAAVMGGRGRNMAWTDLRRLFAYGMETEKAAE